MEPTFNAILVPKGAEYSAVSRGVQKVVATPPLAPLPQVFAIPVGPQPVTQYLQQWLQTWKTRTQCPPQILMMGLCGSLTAKHRVGEVVSYRGCYDGSQFSSVPMSLTPRSVMEWDDQGVGASPVMGVTCDRIIHTAAQKHQLATTYQADVVDMEGFAALSFFQVRQIPMAILRVVSDDAHHDLPDLTSVLTSTGELQPLPLAINLLRQPFGAMRLIQGSLRGLRVLSEVTTRLFCEPSEPSSNSRG